MAGITSSSTFPFKLLYTRTTRPSFSPLSSSSDSKVFGLPLSNPNSLKLDSSLSVSLSLSLSHPTLVNVTARYGGGGGGPRSSAYAHSRRRQSDSDDDEQALDISSLRSDSVRLIDQSQNMVGVVSTSQALQMAEDAELDLVIVSPDADPPVVRIMDYSKYRYELQKKKREQQKKSAANRMDLKELKMG